MERLSRIETLSLGRKLTHLLPRMEARPERLVSLQPLQHVRQAQRIGPAKDAAAEGREADAQDQAHVHVARLADDALLQHPAGLNQHWQEQAVGDLLGAEFAPFLANALQNRGER